jgi:hypothetical protein
MHPTLSPTTAVPPAAVVDCSHSRDLVTDLTDTSRAARYMSGRAQSRHRRAAAASPADPPGLFHDDVTVEVGTG